MFTGDSAELVRAVLEIHARPMTRGELIADLSRRAGAPVPEAIVDEVVALLAEDGALVAPARSARPPLAARRVVLAISGAVAAVDAPQLVRGLHGLGCEVRIAMSKSAKQFVAVAALQALTHHQVWTSLWQRDARVPVPHVNLAEWAELVVVCPATATTLARIATGDCSDLVSAIVTATRAPVVIVPSMNDAMYASPAVQQNLDTLRAHGRWLVHPALGVEVAHRPDDRRPLIGPAPPAAAVLDIVRHVLAHQEAPRLPTDAAGWERLWAAPQLELLPWHADTISAPLAAALDARRGRLNDHGTAGRLLDLGTGAGTVAIEAARRGFAVTATDISATALGRARERAGDLPILFVLDDVRTTRVPGEYDVAVDVGLLHCLPRDAWPAYASAVTARIATGGSLLVVTHDPGVQLATTPATADDLRALLPAFELTASSPTTLSRAPATLFELARR